MDQNTGQNNDQIPENSAPNTPQNEPHNEGLQPQKQENMTPAKNDGEDIAINVFNKPVEKDLGIGNKEQENRASDQAEEIVKTRHGVSHQEPQVTPAQNGETVKPSHGVSPQEPQINIPQQVTPAQKEETVNANHSASHQEHPKTPDTQAPAQKKPKSKLSIIGCLGGLLFLYILTIILGIFILWLNKDNATFLGNFGLINDADLKSFLLVAINWSFFPLAIIFFILVTIGLFIMASSKKEQKDRKKRGLRMIIINIAALFIIIPVWLGIYNFVNQLQVSAQQIIEEIVVSPADTSTLTAPATIDFSLANIQKVINRQGRSIATIEWDFDGDGAFETPTQDIIISQLFPTSGSFNVQVKITLNDGQEGVYQKLITVPQGSFKATPQIGPAPLSVTFDASVVTEGQQIKRYQWDFDGDNIFDEEGNERSVTHIYDKIGDYIITLQTIDANNTVKRYTQTVEVQTGDFIQAEAVIDVQPGTAGTAPYRINLSGADSASPFGQIQSYEWNFGDGSTPRNGRNINHTYEKPGKYEVTLTITDESGEQQKTSVEIEVSGTKSAPEAVITTNPSLDAKSQSLKGALPLVVNFDGTKSTDKDNNIVDYAWDFESDGENDNFGSKVQHSFEKPGEYIVTLTVRDADDQASESSVTIIVEELDTQAVIKATPEAGPIPLTVQFDGSESQTSDGTKIVNYEWDFGDGTDVIPTGANVSHKYEKIGTYTVTLKVFSESGETATTTKQIFARVVPLQACFEPSRSSGEAPLTVTFDASCSQGNSQQWKWNFGDGFTSTNRKPTHTFKSAKNFTVTLEVTDNKNNVSTYESVITVE